MAMTDRPRLLSWLLSAAFAAPAAAQQTPSAGDVLRNLPGMKAPAGPPPGPSASIEVTPQDRPAMRGIDSPGVDVKAFRITGLSVVDEQPLLDMLASRIGPGRRFSDLQAAADAVAEQLRAAGYFLAHAYLPAQQVSDGVVEIAVLEGRIGQVPAPRRHGEIAVSEAVVASLLKALQPGTVIHEHNIERALFLLGDLRGVQVRSVLQPGQVGGTADLLIELSPPCSADSMAWPVRRRTDCRLEATVEADNLGSRYTGELRVGGSLTWNGPLRRGDSLTMRGMVTTSGELSFGRLAYLMPVGGWGSKVGAAYSSLNYRLGTDAFSELDAHGSAQVASFYATHPFARGRNFNLFATLAHDQRRLHDLIDAVGIVNHRALDSSQLSLVGDSRDRWQGGGINNFSLGLTAGRLDIRTPDQLALDTASGNRTQGSYTRWNAAFARLQALGPTLLGFVSATLQTSSKNLDHSEKLSAGGPDTVRAYAPGEAAADQVVVLTTELRFPVPMPQGSVIPGDVVGALFFDGSHGFVNKDPLPTDQHNRRTLRGAGFGLTWGRPDDFLVRASLAWRLSDPPSGDPSDRLPRLHLQVSKSM